jgi:plasmid stability protein
MPTSLTLKALPDELHARLKLRAHANHRSLNSEIIAMLSAQALPQAVSAQEQLARIRSVRERLPATQQPFDHSSFAQSKREGRA